MQILHRLLPSRNPLTAIQDDKGRVDQWKREEQNLSQTLHIQSYR
jgi:hypothetical protein